MHEINVIKGPGGCFSLFVNVPHAENMPRAVSTGLQNYKKPFTLCVPPEVKAPSFPSYRVYTSRKVYLPFLSLSLFFIPLLSGQYLTME